MYYVEGDPKKCFTPDTFVAFGVRSGRRRIWKVWEEGKGPDVVVEITSRETSSEDLGSKQALCARLGVTEYWLYDPESDYLDPALQGYRLIDGAYKPIPPDIRGGYVSEVLGLRMKLVDGLIALFDAEKGTPVPRINALRQEQALKIAEHDVEIAERDAAIAERDAEIARLRAALAKSQ